MQSDSGEWQDRKKLCLTDKRTDVWSRDFMIWKVNFGLWAVAWAGLCNKRVWANYEQLLRPVFSLFRGQKKIQIFFWKHHSFCTEKLQRKKVKKIYFFIGKIFFFRKNIFFRAKIWVEFECKYREVGNRLLLAILCIVLTHWRYYTGYDRFLKSIWHDLILKIWCLSITAFL